MHNSKGLVLRKLHQQAIHQAHGIHQGRAYSNANSCDCEWAYAAPCPVGSYLNTSLAYCLACPLWSATLAEGSTSLSQCSYPVCLFKRVTSSEPDRREARSLDPALSGTRQHRD